MFSASIAFLLVLPLLLSLVTARRTSRHEFLLNSGNTGFLQTTASIISGNVGIGSFVAVFLFANVSPVIGFSIVAADTVGLFLCALLAQKVHDMSRKTETSGLVDLIVKTHKVRHPMLVWLPVAFIFVLRTAVQLMALAVIIQGAFGVSFLPSLLIAAVFTASYIILGGYKAATQTDLLQALVLLALVCVLWSGLPLTADTAPHAFLDLGPYKPVLLVGVWIFLPFSLILSVDNWQRIATTRDAATATKAYSVAAIISGGVLATIAWCGYVTASGADVFATFRSFMPDSAPWLADVMIAASIMSSIDTFVMPLMTTLGRYQIEKSGLRLAIVGFFGVVVSVCYLYGDVFEGLIAAFNSLAILLPVTIGALYGSRQSAPAAILSLNVGFVFTLVLTMVDMNVAGVAGFLFSLLVYAGFSVGNPLRSARALIKGTDS